MPANRPRLLVLNQYYWPGVEATAHLLSQLCGALAEDFEVTVVTGRLHDHPEAPAEEVRDGVRIVRVPSAALDRTALGQRAVNYASYLALALAAGLRASRPDIVLCMTDPPMIADVALAVARRYRAPLVVISQDVFPEIAVELKRVESGVLVGLLGALVGFYLKRADRVVAIGERMRERLEAKSADPARLRVIPNWVDTSAIEPLGKDNDWARRRKLERRFVVMHSGNVGHAQDLDSLVRAATFLRDLDDLSIVIIGTGARRAELGALAERLEVDRVSFVPYQPRELLSQTLSSADVHVVGLARGLSGFVVPSRLYGVLAAGRPVIAAADDDGETALVVREAGCGIVVPPGRPELLAQAIRAAHDGELELAEMGRRAREYVVAEGDVSVAIERYRALLREIRAERAA